ncbi:MAG: hypothetical protein V4850_09560 [Myxococcota bacterium]
MSVVDPWTVELETELRALLAPGAVPSEHDDWRLLVLLARVALHPDPPPALGALPDESGRCGRTRQALVGAVRPYPAAVLESLDDALVGNDDPAGPLADALLDVDDLLGVLELEGRHGEARQIATAAAALVELAPELASALAGWAARRLATLDESAAAAELWRAVESAGAIAVTLALPAASSGRPNTAAILDRADRPRLREAEVIELFAASATVRRAWRAAAADLGVTPEPTYGPNWAVYTEGERVMAQLRASSGHAPAGTARLVARAGDCAWTSTLRAARRGTDSSWFDLGTESELAVSFAEAREHLGVGPDTEIAVRLEWDADG